MSSDNDRQQGKRHSNCFTCQSRDRSQWCVLSKDDMSLLNRSKTSRVYDKGQVIYYQGNPCFGIYCVEEGSVVLRRGDSKGRSIVTRIVHEGATLGYLDYFSGKPHCSTAEALSRTRVCFVERSSLRVLLDRNPAVGHQFLGTLSNDLRAAEQEKLQLVTLPLRTRVAHLLLVLRDRYGEVTDDGTLIIELPVSRQDIAALLGVRHESVSRAIRQIEDDGLARFESRKVFVQDLDPLLDEVEKAGAA